VSDGPVVIVEDAKFRIVRLAEGDKVIYVTETPDGCDALGVERWRELKMDNKHWGAFRDYIIRATLKEKK
jgi:phage gp45-like